MTLHGPTQRRDATMGARAGAGIFRAPTPPTGTDAALRPAPSCPPTECPGTVHSAMPSIRDEVAALLP